MLNIFQKFRMENLKNAVIGIFKRMPVSALISLMAFADMASIIHLENKSYGLENNLAKTLITLVVAFFFSVAVYFICEKRQFGNTKKWACQAVTAVLAALFFYFFDENILDNAEMETIVYVALTVIGVLAFMFIAPFVKKYKVSLNSQESFYVSTYGLMIRSIMSIIVGNAVLILGFIALQSVFTLFDIQSIHKENWFGYWAAFSIFVFGPMFFLANLPKFDGAENANINEVSANRFYSFLINYVGLGAITIYFLILYAYTAKVFLNFKEWPHGEVTWMVILFSFFGYLVYFATYAFAPAFKPAYLFRRILPAAVLLQTFMLFYAIGLRIRQYDLTINRYLVLVFGLWLLGLSLYFILSRKKDLSVPFYSLLVVVILMSLGPWSVYVVPEWRQEARLKKNLAEAGILKADGSIVPLGKYKDIDKGLSKEIYGGIDYLSRYHGIKTLKPLFAKEIGEIAKKDEEDWRKQHEETLKDLKRQPEVKPEVIANIENEKYRGLSSWTLVAALAQKLKVEDWQSGLAGNEPMYWRFENESLGDMGGAVAVSGFDYYLNIQPNGGKYAKAVGTQDENISTTSLSMSLDDKGERLDLYRGKDLIDSYEIMDAIIKPITQNEKNYIEPDSQDPSLKAKLKNENMTFDLPGKAFDARIVLRSLSVENPSYEARGQDAKGAGPKSEPLTDMLDGYALLRKK